MKKLLVLSLLSILPAVANAGELKLPGEKWLAEFTKFVCTDAGTEVARPAALERLNVVFGRLTTDSTLDNVLVKATFDDAGKACSYNAILLADNAARTARLVESSAFEPSAENRETECAAGKAVIDAALAQTQYLYYGHPHNIALMLPGVGAEAVCGGNATVGANFVVRGKVPAPQP